MLRFYENVETVAKQRKHARYVSNRQWVIDNLDPEQYKLLDHIKAVLIRVKPDKSVLFYLTRNMWKYNGMRILGTPSECMRWIEKERARGRIEP